MEEKRKKIRSKKKKKFKLFRPIEIYALLLTAFLSLLFIYLIDATKPDRQVLANKTKEMVYKRAYEIAQEEKGKYLQQKEQGVKDHWYDTLTPKQKEAIKKEYEFLKKVNN